MLYLDACYGGVMPGIDHFSSLNYGHCFDNGVSVTRVWDTDSIMQNFGSDTGAATSYLNNFGAN